MPDRRRTDGRHAAGVLDSDREILDAALGTLGLVEPADARIMWTKNTLQVAEVECSERYLEEARGRDDLEILTEPRPLEFDANGDFVDYEPALAAHAH